MTRCILCLRAVEDFQSTCLKCDDLWSTHQLPHTLYFEPFEIKRVRESIGLRQLDVAQHIGQITVGRISQIEKSGCVGRRIAMLMFQLFDAHAHDGLSDSTVVTMRWVSNARIAYAKLAQRRRNK